jgi:hypothetical protein
MDINTLTQLNLNSIQLRDSNHHPHEAVVKLLLEKAVDVDSKDSCSQTPLS